MTDTPKKAEWVDCPVCDDEADESPDCSRCLGIGSVCSVCGGAYGVCRCEHEVAEYRHVPVWCPTCDQVDCPHAAAPVTPEGELTRLRRERDDERAERIKASAAIQALFLDGADEGAWPPGTRYADALGPFVDRLYAEIARLRRRLETLELQRGM